MSTPTLYTPAIEPHADIAAIWSLERFPVLSEAGQIKAVMVDIASFAHIQLILDNLLNRESEAEDAILAASTTLKQLIASAQQQVPSSDWESELDLGTIGGCPSACLAPRGADANLGFQLLALRL